MKSLPLACALALGVAAPAFAQDTAAEANFTGFRVEGHLGYDRPNIELNRFDFDPTVVTSDEVEGDGLLYGVGVGYDFDFGGVVAGVEAGIDWTTAEGKVEIFDETVDTGIDFGRDIEIGARVGTRIGNNTLIYLKGAYTNFKVEFPASDEVDLADESSSNDFDGWRVGGGIEFALPIDTLGTSTFAKVEYRYSDYEDDVSKHQLLAGFGFRF